MLKWVIIPLMAGTAVAGRNTAEQRLAQHTYIPGVSTVTITKDGFKPFPYEVLEYSDDPADYIPAPVPDLQPAVNALVADDTVGRIVVSDVVYADGRESGDGGVIAARVALALSNVPVPTVERAKIAQVLEELKFQHSGAVDSTTAIKLGRMLGAQKLVMGTITELADGKLMIVLRLVDVTTAEILRTASAVITKNWVTPPVAAAEEQGPVSLGKIHQRSGIQKLPPGGTKVMLDPPRRKEYDPVTGAVYLGSGCGFDLYYEGDGTFMRWARNSPHGVGGSGEFIKRNDNQYCNYALFISEQIRRKHPQLKEQWVKYRQENGF